MLLFCFVPLLPQTQHSTALLTRAGPKGPNAPRTNLCAAAPQGLVAEPWPPEIIFMKCMQFYFKGAFLREPTDSDCFWFSKTRS